MTISTSHAEATWFEAEARGVEGESGTGRRFDDRLRCAVDAMDRQLSLLAGQGTIDRGASTMGDLLATWAALVDRLALEPAPELRSCPVCGHSGMSAATRCGYCWTRLSPIVPGAPAVRGAGA